MKEKFSSALLILFSLVTVTAGGSSFQAVVARPNSLEATTKGKTAIVPALITPTMASSFETSEYVTNQTTAFKTKYKLDSTIPCGQEEVRQEGEDGAVTKRFRRIIWQGNMIADELIASEEQPATDEIITLGIKPGEEFTVEGQTYNCVLKNFWATSYDGNCKGCSGRTYYTGEPVQHGICAVNPTLIEPLSYFYIPGYGRCKAADKGGGLTRKRVDLGFDDVKNGWWHAHLTDLYLYIQ